MFFKNSEKKVTTNIDEPKTDTPIKTGIADNRLTLRMLFGNSFDLLFRELEVGGTDLLLAVLDGMCDTIYLTQAILRPLQQSRLKSDAGLFEKCFDRLFDGAEHTSFSTIEEAATALIAGSAVLFIDGEDRCIGFSAPDFPKKSIGEPLSEQQEKGSRESFTDFFKDNVTLLRRRLRTPLLHIDKMTLGNTSNTNVCLCFLSDRVGAEMLDEVKTRISKVKLDVLLGAGYLRPFLDHNTVAMFSGIGTTERPDTLAAKLAEGRIGILIDGIPFALFLPQLFIDHLHSMDDYLSRPYYAILLRTLRFACFVIATMLPGLFVAVCVFHPELLPADVMFDIARSKSHTPFPMMLEALVIHFIYEIVREAGLRMPKMVGHAVGIVGALVIGDAAVTAGLISAPMLIVVALTAICTAVLTGIHEPLALLRFLFIIAGGTMGLYGIMLMTGVLVVNMCGISPYGLPYTAPLTPMQLGAQRDTFFRESWRRLGRRRWAAPKMKY